MATFHGAVVSSLEHIAVKISTQERGKVTTFCVQACYSPFVLGNWFTGYWRHREAFTLHSGCSLRNRAALPPILPDLPFTPKVVLGPQIYSLKSMARACSEV